MKRFMNWQTALALILVLLSAVFYLIHYLIFKDIHHIAIYLIGDIAFLFLDVLIVMLVLHRLLVYREKQLLIKKLNMVIGVFFNETGTELLKKCRRFEAEPAGIEAELIVTREWSDKDFIRARGRIQHHEISMDSQKHGLDEIKALLTGRRQFLLNLLENPNLLEHESFTNLLWAVFHLADELEHRKDLNNLSVADHQHLSQDMKRAYQQLVLQWLDYMKHLKQDYPYLFSLAMRTNPFDVNAVVEIKQ